MARQPVGVGRGVSGGDGMKQTRAFWHYAKSIVFSIAWQYLMAANPVPANFTSLSLGHVVAIICLMAAGLHLVLGLLHSYSES